MEFFTIGVYNTTEQTFFDKLIQNKIDAFCDVRQRRGVRGAKYAFVNSSRLQQKLAALNILYRHEIMLAPTTTMREVQTIEDKQSQLLKRERVQLSDAFILGYKKDILHTFNFNQFLETLADADFQRVVLFCVEEHASACHRSIIAETLAVKYHYKITHL